VDKSAIGLLPTGHVDHGHAIRIIDGGFSNVEVHKAPPFYHFIKY
jgi:hypothetical protein